MKLGKALNALGVLALVMALAAIGAPLVPAAASSHREAPMISNDPVADNTDLYAFVSPDKPDTVTFIVNTWPFEEPSGGPNYFRFGDDVLYELHIDNVGDAQSHITYQFRFHTVIGNGNTFLYNTGPISSLDDPELEREAVLYGDPAGRRPGDGARQRPEDAAGEHRPALDP